MRRRFTPISWPRRDPRHYRFAIPNAVWEYQLRPAEFVIFSYLCYHSSHSQVSQSTLEMVAEGVHLSMGTTKKYLVALVDRGIVTAEWSLALDVQCITSEKFFTLPNEVFLLRLSPSAFVTYAYLLLIEDRRTHTCHPSYNTIAAATSLSKNTAMKSISALLDMGLIMVEPSNYFDKRGMKWRGNNLYTIQPVRSAVDAFHQRQLQQLELDTERSCVHKRQAEYNRRHPRTPLCPPAPTQATPDPSQQREPVCAL